MLRFAFIFAVVPALAKAGGSSEGTQPTCNGPDSLRKYPNPAQLNTYFQCVDGSPVKIWCPSRQNFNADKETCEPIQDIDEYPDVDRSKIKCRFHGEYICNPLDKHSFYQCSHGVPYLHYCSAGLVFNRTINVCDYTGPPCVPAGIKCRFHGEYICNPLDKHSFYQCSHGFPYLHYCSAGLVFNRTINVCDYTGPPCRPDAQLE